MVDESVASVVVVGSVPSLLAELADSALSVAVASALLSASLAALTLTPASR